MWFKKREQRKREQYSNQVQSYMKQYGISIVKRILDSSSDNNLLSEANIKEALGTDYPKCPWITDDDVISQFVQLLKEVGYEFCYNEMGQLQFKIEDAYKAIVQNHLKFSGREILSRLSECCQKTYGRVSYEEMDEVLGFHYPKAPNVNSCDNRVCIVLFLKETGIPFKFDETHIYFP